MPKYIIPFIIGAMTLGTISYALAAPVFNIMRSVIPETNSKYYLGTTTPSTTGWASVVTDQVCLTGDVCRTTWPSGGGGGGSGNVSTSSVPVVSQLAYWTTTTATPALLSTVATTTLTLSGFPAVIPSTLGTLVGGSNTTWTWTGLATTSQPSSSNLLVSNGGAGVFGVATSSAACTTGVSCSGFNVVGSVSPSIILATMNAGVLGSVTNGVSPTSQATTTLYGALGTAGFVLMSNGTSAVWAATSTGSGSPGGSNGQLQYNNSSAFGGLAGTFFNNSLVTLGIGTSTPQWLVQLASSTAPQLTLSDGSIGSSHWSFRNAGGTLYLATSSPTSFATTTTSVLNITSAGVFGIGEAGAFTHDITTASTTFTNLIVGPLQTDINPGVFNVFDFAQGGASDATVQSGCFGFCTSGASATSTLTIWGLSTGAANAIRNFSVTIGTSTRPTTGAQEGTDFQISGGTGTTTVSVMQIGARGGRIILKDTSGSTCTEISTQGGTVTGKAVTCPSN